MRMKAGVRIDGIKPEILFGLMIAEEVFAEFKSPMTVTSATDGLHMKGSKHYYGLAVDLRTWSLEGRIATLVAVLRERLGDNFDVVQESDHIHLEYDPHIAVQGGKVA